MFVRAWRGVDFGKAVFLRNVFFVANGIAETKYVQTNVMRCKDLEKDNPEK